MTQQEFYKRYSYSATEDMLGSGGFGKVFRAWDSVEECEVALKIQPVNPQYPSLRLSKEVETAAKLRHPNVARYKECYTFTDFGGETDIAVMSYYKDGSLDKLMKAQALTYEQRVDILTQILEGIAYLHNNDLIHRDLKPQNILILCSKGHYVPKITDFGISKQLTDEEKSVVTNSILVGTRHYASPEQLMERSIHKNTDLWSFGVIAFQMLTGSLPFTSGTFSPTSEEGRAEQYRQMQSGVLSDSIGRIAEPWQTLIRQCLVFDCKYRIAGAEECLSVVGSATEKYEVDVEVEEVVVTPEKNSADTPSSDSGKKPRKSSWLWGVLIFVAILAVGFYVSTFFINQSDDIDNIQTEKLSAEELYYLAENHYDNDNLDDALKYFQRSAEMGYVEAQLELASMYEDGCFGEEDYVMAAKWYRKAAEQGDEYAQWCMADLYEAGLGVPQSYDEAAKWYRKLADQGHASAQFNLGLCYYNGNGVTQSYTEAVKWYRKAADQGHASAQFNLGICYDNGNGVTQSYTEAVKWYRKAADQGNVNAQNNLGVCYYNGNGVTQSRTEAVKWYRKAADHGYARAQCNLGYCYDKGNGVTQSYTEAVKWYRKAADQGYAIAQYNLGLCYEYGTGVTQSYTEAANWYRKAADQGHVEAQGNLGYCYHIAENYTEAIKWYRQAADQGDAYAQFNLGVYYKNGWGVTQSYTEAVKWYRKAADQGDADAQFNLGVHYDKGWGVTQSYTEAVKWYRKAADQGHVDAQYNLGYCYEKGNGVTQSYTEAVKWYQMAARQGQENAQNRLRTLGEFW